MAVLPMKRITICALKKNRKQILELLQRRGVVEISNSIPEDSVFQKADMSSATATFQKNISVASQALDVLDTFLPEKKTMLASLEGRKELDCENYDTFGGERDELIRIAYRLIALSKQIAENKGAVLKLSAQLEGLTPWLDFDIPLDFQGTKTTAAFIGSLSGGATRETILSTLTELAPALYAADVNIISSSKEQTCVFIVCTRADAQEMEEALRKMGFARPPMLSSVIPAKRKEELSKEIEGLRLSSLNAEKEIRTYAGGRNALRFVIDYYTMRSEKYDVISSLVQSRNVFLLQGYIPEKDATALEAVLNDRFHLAVELETPSENEDVPVALHNGRFFEPVEWVLQSYSFPGKGEIDPTVLMSVFYYVLFGLMLSDAAYGLIMMMGCGFCLIKFKNMEMGTRKTLRMFFFCGISTVFWGAMFGSWFGDVVKVVSSTFFGTTVTVPPIWFEPITEPMRMLVFCMAFGVVHIYVGLGAKFYQCIKARQYKDALYDVVFWYALVTSLIVILLSTQQFVSIAKLNFILPQPAAKIAGAIATIAAAGITLTAGRESRNWFKRILKGLYGLYNVTGYLSDVLSYSRLLALGLATGVIATVINQMGSMGGNSVVGVILFIAVFLVGHSINISINLLGAYVHTNRLQFVEFFGKFYEGGGREFAPFAMHTKYYKIKEETNHG